MEWFMLEGMSKTIPFQPTAMDGEPSTRPGYRQCRLPKKTNNLKESPPHLSVFSSDDSVQEGRSELFTLLISCISVLISCSIHKKAESWSMPSSGQQSCALCCREILAPQTCTNRNEPSGRQEVPDTLGAAADGTDADFVCSTMSEEGSCTPRLPLCLLFSLKGQISSYFSVLKCCL